MLDRETITKRKVYIPFTVKDACAFPNSNHIVPFLAKRELCHVPAIEMRESSRRTMHLPVRIKRKDF